MCFAHSQCEGGGLSPPPFAVSFVLALNKAHVLALNPALVLRLNKVCFWALNKAHVLRLNNIVLTWSRHAPDRARKWCISALRSKQIMYLVVTPHKRWIFPDYTKQIKHFDPADPALTDLDPADPGLATPDRRFCDHRTAESL